MSPTTSLESRQQLLSGNKLDALFMSAALEQARLAQGMNEVPVGAIVAYKGEIIGQGYNRTITDQDPSAHAEVVALRVAAKRIENHRLIGSELYVTLEPCVMCAGAILHARIARVVFATPDERSGAAGSIVDVLDSPLMNHRCQVQSGILQQKSANLLKQFFADKR